MKININDWGAMYSNNEVKKVVENYKVRLFKFSENINPDTINEIYDKIVNESLSDRAKLFHLENFENLLIKSKIQTTEDAIRFKNSLFE